MKVRLDPEAAAVLRSMAPERRRQIRAALRLLAEDPSGETNRLDVKRLRTPGEPAAFRLRLGEWRVVWLLRAESLDVVRIFRRREGYGWLDRDYR